jgi:phenylpropionate dioxygenase-like ring-hydroxylating dioxygenase large terminal subunit
MLTSQNTYWLASLCDDQAFAEENSRLRSFWTFVGFTTELPRHNDWIRRDLWGRSIFIQNFNGELRGFTNLCLHRLFPIRTADCGNGPVQCPFHHWTYDKTGKLIGVPMSKDLFGGPPKTLGMQLGSVDVETCGNLIFARMPAAPGGPDLATFLGPAAPILKYFTEGADKPVQDAMEIAANWRLSVHMTLDDYHLVAVHPSTFGKDGYLKGDLPRYYEFGAHSAYFTEGGPDELENMSKACAAGTYVPGGYRIFSFFPNLSVIQITAMYHWYIVVLSHQPLARDQALISASFFEAPFAKPKNPVMGAIEAVQRPFRNFFFRYFFHRILREDNTICEQFQRLAAGQSHELPRFGAHEERIAWFENTYRDLVGNASVPDLEAVSGPNSFGKKVKPRP